MDKFLVPKASGIAPSKKRTRTDAFGEAKDNEEDNIQTKKRRFATDQEAEISSDHHGDHEDEYVEDDDLENTNNSNTNIDAELNRLRRKIKDLTTENQKLRAENQKLKTRNKTLSSTPAAKATKSKVDAGKLRKKYLQKWATRMVKVAGMKKTKFTGDSKEIMIEDVGFERAEFDAIFGEKGDLIQPRPDYKPTSSVIIRRFDAWDSIKEMFGEYGLSEEVTVSIWRNRNFSKSFYSGQGTAKIASLDVCYNKSRKVLQLKFQCERDFGECW